MCVCVCVVRFMLSPAVPDTLIRIMRDVKPVTEIKQNGEDFVVTVKTPLRSTTNSFTLGRESIINTLDGKKLKVSINTVPLPQSNTILKDYTVYAKLLHRHTTAKPKDTAHTFLDINALECRL